MPTREDQLPNPDVLYFVNGEDIEIRSQYPIRASGIWGVDLAMRAEFEEATVPSVEVQPEGDTPVRAPIGIRIPDEGDGVWDNIDWQPVGNGSAFATIPGTPDTIRGRRAILHNVGVESGRRLADACRGITREMTQVPRPVETRVPSDYIVRRPETAEERFRRDDIMRFPRSASVNERINYFSDQATEAPLHGTLWTITIPDLDDDVDDGGLEVGNGDINTLLNL